MADTNAIKQRIGLVTAYAYAVMGGYVGTEAEFTEALGRAGIVVEQLENLTAVATTLSEGAEATASYAEGVLTFGIPKGDTGATGPQGETGPKGDTGNGIVSITKTATVGKVDTYTITFTDGNITTFDVTNGEVTLEQMQAAIEAALVDYAEIDGTYPYMTAGMAQSLDTDDVVTDTKPYLYRQTGADAVREYDEIVGGSAVVNQLFNLNGSIGNNNGTVAIANNILTFTATYKSTYQYINQGSIVCPANHKLLISVDVTLSQAETVGFGDGATIYKTVSLNANTKTRIAYIRNFETNRTMVYIYPARTSGLDVDGVMTVENFAIIDLTAMFGSAIADYAYTLEQTTAGSGIAWLKSYGFFADEYIPYNSGELKHVSGLTSHDMTGFNQWDEDWEVGAFNTTTGANTPGTGTQIRSKKLISVLPGIQYYINRLPSVYVWMMFFDENENIITTGLPAFVISGNSCGVYGVFQTPDNCHYIKFYTQSGYGATYKNDICINISNPQRNGEYEPYIKHSYPLDNDVVLRGPLKLVDGQIKYDGDVYPSSGQVSRKYALVDLGTLTGYATNGQNNVWVYVPNKKIGSDNTLCTLRKVAQGTAASAMVDGDYKTYSDSAIIAVCKTGINPSNAAEMLSGVMLVYELATPTAETATPYQSPQICDPDGTEEYVGSAIPVGHNTKYPANLVGRLEKLPDIPTTAGTYNLQVTVTSGKATAQWVSV